MEGEDLAIYSGRLTLEGTKGPYKNSKVCMRLFGRVVKTTVAMVKLTQLRFICSSSPLYPYLTHNRHSPPYIVTSR